MQLIQAGKHQLVALEFDQELLRQGAQETGFEIEIDDQPRVTNVTLRARERDTPLLLFDASDPANTGWFSRCMFYVDGRTGAVLQTPFIIANYIDPQGRLSTKALSLQILKELPQHFRLPGRQPLAEKAIYAVLFNFLNALQKVGVGVCGIGSVRALAGRVVAPSR
ncbi:MAG: hypothetical protein P4K98_01015 [Bryobacteraceae bacterium]|nr:hypothetical protein [Bryobacteraceae bacterium]